MQRTVNQLLTMMKDAVVLVYALQDVKANNARWQFAWLDTAGFTETDPSWPHTTFVKQYSGEQGAYYAVEIRVGHARNPEAILMRGTDHAGAPPLWRYTFTNQTPPSASYQQSSHTRPRKVQQDAVLEALAHVWHRAFRRAVIPAPPGIRILKKFIVTPSQAASQVDRVKELLKEERRLHLQILKKFKIPKKPHSNNEVPPPPLREPRPLETSTDMPFFNAGALRAIAERDPRAAAHLSALGRRGHDAAGNVAPRAWGRARTAATVWHTQTVANRMLVMMRDAVLILMMDRVLGRQRVFDVLRYTGFRSLGSPSRLYKTYTFGITRARINSNRLNDELEYHSALRVPADAELPIRVILYRDIYPTRAGKVGSRRWRYTFTAQEPPEKRFFRYDGNDENFDINMFENFINNMNMNFVMENEPQNARAVSQAISLAWHIAFRGTSLISNQPGRYGVKVKRNHKLTEGQATQVVLHIRNTLEQIRQIQQKASSRFA